MLKYLATESTRSVAAIQPLRLSGAQRHLSLILGSVPENGELRVVVLKERLMKKSRDSEVAAPA